jgi:hypothetical protein
VARVTHALAAAGAGEYGDGGGRWGQRGGVDARGLEGEPFFEAGAAEGVQAVEEGEGLVEEVGAYLCLLVTCSLEWGEGGRE